MNPAASISALGEEGGETPEEKVVKHDEEEVLVGIGTNCGDGYARVTFRALAVRAIQREQAFGPTG